MRFYPNSEAGAFPRTTIRPKKYVPKWIKNGVMAVFMFAGAILAAILNISISPRMLEWHETDYEWVGNKVTKTTTNFWWSPMQGSSPCCRTSSGGERNITRDVRTEIDCSSTWRKLLAQYPDRWWLQHYGGREYQKRKWGWLKACTRRQEQAWWWEKEHRGSLMSIVDCGWAAWWGRCCS